MHWNIAAALAALSVPMLAHAQHSNLYVSTETVAFEDLAGGASDADQNDLVFRYNRRCEVDESSRLVAETIHLAPVAAGAQKTNALVLELPEAPSRVTVDTGSGPRVVAADALHRVLVTSDFAGLLGGTRMVNTGEQEVIAAGQPVVVEATYSAGPTLAGACPSAEFALSRPEDGVFLDGDSTLANGQPLRGIFPGDWLVPTERTPLSRAYPQFAAWLADVVDGCDGTCDAVGWYEAPESVHTVARPSLDTTAPLDPPATCDDGEENQTEQLVDCGGTVCVACGPVIHDVTVSDTTVEPGQSVELSVSASYPDGDPAPVTWYVAEDSWSVADDNAATTSLTAPTPDGPFAASTAVDVVAGGPGEVWDVERVQVEAFAHPDCQAQLAAGDARGSDHYWISPAGPVDQGVRVFCLHDDPVWGSGWTLVGHGPYGATDDQFLVFDGLGLSADEVLLYHQSGAAQCNTGHAIENAWSACNGHTSGTCGFVVHDGGQEVFRADDYQSCTDGGSSWVVDGHRPAFGSRLLTGPGTTWGADSKVAYVEDWGDYSESDNGGLHTISVLLR